MHEKLSTKCMSIKDPGMTRFANFLCGIGACQMLVYDYCYEMHDKIVCIRFELQVHHIYYKGNP